MKSLEQQMAVYAAYHRDPLNRATHFIGVPLITFAILVALAWLRVPVAGVELTAALVFVAVVLAYYLLLDVPFAVAMTVLILPALYAAEQVARLPWETGLSVFAVTFVGGWVFQFLGHYWEGRRPALADNLFQIFIAPLFLAAEIAFALGLRRRTQHDVERLSHSFDA